MSGQQSKQSPSDLATSKAPGPGPSDDSKEALEQALASFQSTLNDEERVKLQRMKGSPCDAGSIIQFTHELDGLDVNRRGKSVATTLHSLFQSVEQFYQIADTYVSSHPEIAALIWGSVKLAFMVGSPVFSVCGSSDMGRLTASQVLGNFTSYFQKFSELLRGFDQLLPRFAEYRRLFPNSSRLRCATFELQTAIVRCCAEMVLATRRPWQKQLVAALSQSFQAEIRPLVNDIRAKAKFVKEEVDLAKTQADHEEQVLQSQERHQAGESRREVSRWFANSDKEMQKSRQEQMVRAKENRWNTILERLSHYDYTAAFKSARGKRHNGTAEWVFRTTEFETWYDNDTSVILHLMGKIGSGKTVLTANVVDHLIRFRQQTLQAVAFFFVRFDDPPSQQSECILRSVIGQLFQHGSGDPGLLQLLETSSDQFFDNDSLMALWSERVRSFKDFFLILDGFDECTLADRKIVSKSISIISEACKQTTRVKILLSSRSSVRQEIDNVDVTTIRLTLSAGNIGEDLKRYAEEMLDEKVSTKELVIQDESLLNNILQVVSIGGEGMFLWVFLTIEDICCRTSDSEIRESLRSIPRKLPETFDRALQRITNNGKADIAQAIFNWTATVRRPLTLNQLKESLSISVGQSHSTSERYPSKLDQLASWCENLLHVEETDETVRFCHHSVRKYLLKHSKAFRIPQKDWDHHIGEICLTYLDFTDFKKALAKRSEPTSVNVTNYPAGITSETVRKLLPAVKNHKVITSVQQWFQTSDRQIFVHDSQINARGASKPILGYPFFQYASDQWIFHTTGFRSRTTKTWDLWKTMINTELTSWVDSNWEPKDCAPSSGNWVPTGQHTVPEFVRDHFVSWHKAVLLAEFTEHYALMEQIFSVLRQHRADLNPRLLRALMSSKQISVGLYSPLPLTLDDSDIHGTVVHIFTRYIAMGGWVTVEKSTEREDCDLAPGETHLDGIRQDVCTLLCKRRWVSGQSAHVRRYLSQITLTELDENLRKTIISALRDPHANDFREARTIQRKTIVNLVIERDQLWWLTIADSMSRELKLSPLYSIMMRESLEYTLKTQDATSAELLLQEGKIDWTDEGTMDHKLIRCAAQFKKMNRGLRKRFISSVIDSRSSTQIAYEIMKKQSKRPGDWTQIRRQSSVESTNEDPMYYHPDYMQQTVFVDSIDNHPPPQMATPMFRFHAPKTFENSLTEFDKEMHLYSLSILEAVHQSAWDIAVALYRHTSGLIATETLEPPDLHIVNKVLRCITQPEELGNICYVTEAGGDGVQIVYCKNHIGMDEMI